jgi:hypothetical protein
MALAASLLGSASEAQFWSHLFDTLAALKRVLATGACYNPTPATVRPQIIPIR